MRLHTLKKKTPNKKSRQIGRGGKRGKTSGRGHKGQKSRAGHRMRPEARDIIKKLPKLRGRGSSSFKSYAEKIYVINLDKLSTSFKDGDTVTSEAIFEKELIEAPANKRTYIKVLGNGSLNIKLNFSGLKVSKSAADKIKKAGGTIVE